MNAIGAQEPIDQRDMLAIEAAHVAGLRGADADAARSNPTGRPIGLAFSGGGIRSATFCLGVVQALAERQWLRRFDYLSTVSGGGYIGAWLSAVLFRHRQRGVAPDALIAQVEEMLSPREIRKKGEEPGEIGFLRAYSNYLTPRLGLFSADTLAALTGYLRNLCLSMLLAVLSLGLVLAAVHGLVGLLVLVREQPELQRSLLIMVAVVAGVVLFLCSLLLTLQSLDARADLEKVLNSGLALGALHFLQSSFGRMLLYVLLPMPILLGILLETASGDSVDPWIVLAVVAVVAVVFAVGAWMAYSVLELVRKLAQQTAASGTMPLLNARQQLLVMLNAVWAAVREGSGELLRYLVALLAASCAAFLALLLVSQLPPVTPAEALFRGPALVVAIAGLVFVVWIGVVGTTYSEQTREWLSRLFGTVIGWLAAWLAAGALVLVARPVAQWAQSLLVGPAAPTDVRPWLAAVAALVAALAWLSRGGDTFVGRLIVRMTLPLTCGLLALVVLAGATIGFQRLLLNMAAVNDTGAPPGAGLFGRHVGEISRAAATWQPPQWPSSIDWQFDGLVATLGTLRGAIPALTLLLVCLAAAVAAFRYVDVNAFSLQNLYRNRLVRCYLGAAHHQSRLAGPYAGFDPLDDLALRDLADQRPYLLMNSALNITQGDDLAWQQRKAASFCFTPGRCGYWLNAPKLSGLVNQQPRVEGGFVRTAAFASESLGRRHEPRGVLLGTAMATSGAAVSPQMGFASSGFLAFVLTLANVRLGRWFPNPRLGAAADSLKQTSPLFAAFWYLRELLGSTNEKSRWVYLSDGGHFENLAIYELVRRRCRFIIAVDAAADPTMSFGDLGNAVHKCRVDFGVNIHIDLSGLRPQGDMKRPTSATALGRIDYPPTADEQAFTGDILYVKASMPLDVALSADVLSFAAGNAAFPHQTTSDQWFTESQFESYRQLGYQLGRSALRRAVPVFDRIEQMPDAEALLGECG